MAKTFDSITGAAVMRQAADTAKMFDSITGAAVMRQAADMAKTFDSVTGAALLRQTAEMAKTFDLVTASGVLSQVADMAKVTDSAASVVFSHAADMATTIDPVEWASIVERLSSEVDGHTDGETDGQSQMSGEVIAVGALYLFLVVVMLLQHNDIASAMAVLKMLVALVGIEANAHPFFSGALILWGLFGNSIKKAMKDEED